MAPEGELDQSIYGSGFGMGVESMDDGSATAGTFGEPKSAATTRRLAAKADDGDGAAKLAFRPVVTTHNENGIVIKVEFDDPDQVGSTGTGAVNMAIKAPSIFKTKETMTSLNNDAFKGGKPELGGPVPPIITNPWESEMIKSNSKISTDWLNLFNAGNFFIMLVLGGTMRQLWGLIRTVQMVTFSTVVNVKLPINLFIFLRLYVYFAMMDVLQGRELYKSILHFKDASPFNGTFAFFGFYDSNMINHSGSYFLIQIAILCYIIFKISLNQLAKTLNKNYYARKLGIWAYEDSYTSVFGVASSKLFMESYFELFIFTIINVLAFEGAIKTGDFKQFYSTPLEVVSTSLVGAYLLLFLIYPLFGAVLICMNAEKIRYGKIPVQLQPFLQGLKLDNLNCTMYNIFFLMRRATTAVVLVVLQNHPYFQCCFLVVLSLTNISYQIIVKPFELRKDNYIEVFNEFCILGSSYMMCIFLDKQSSQKFLKLVGWSFMGLTFVNVGLNAVALLFNHLYEGIEGLRKQRKEQKVIDLCKIRLKNLQKIASIAPTNFNYVQREIESYENIQVMKTWWPHYIWMKKNHLDFKSLKEHQEFNKISQRMSARQRVNDV